MSALAALQIGAAASDAALLAGYQAAFWTAAVLAALGLIVATLGVHPAGSHAPAARN